MHRSYGDRPVPATISVARARPPISRLWTKHGRPQHLAGEPGLAMDPGRLNFRRCGDAPELGDGGVLDEGDDVPRLGNLADDHAAEISGEEDSPARALDDLGHFIGVALVGVDARDVVRAP